METVDNKNELVFTFEKEKYVGNIGCSLMALIFMIVALIVKWMDFSEEGIIWLVFFVIFLWMAIRFRKQKMLSSNLRVTIDQQNQAFIIERTDNDRKQITLPFHQIKRVSYYSNQMFKSQIGYQGKQISTEYVLIEAQDGHIVYLGFFYKFFQHILDHKDSYPFYVDIHTCDFMHFPYSLNLMPDLYD